MTSKKVCTTCFKKGRTPWNKGLKGIHVSPETEFKVGQFTEEKHPSWSGDKIGYYGLHQWVKKHLGKANHCSICNISGKNKYQWANKSHTYKRDTADWTSLCIKCHRKYDCLNKLDEEKARNIRKLYCSGVSQNDLAKKYFVDQSLISRVVNKVRW